MATRTETRERPPALAVTTAAVVQLKKHIEMHDPHAAGIRLGVRGYPSISVLDGSSVYDY